MHPTLFFQVNSHSIMANGKMSPYMNMGGIRQHGNVPGGGTPITIDRRGGSPIPIGRSAGHISVRDTTLQHRGQSPLSSSPMMDGGTNGLSSSPGPTKRGNKSRISSPYERGPSNRYSTSDAPHIHQQHLSPPDASASMRKFYSDSSLHQTVVGVQQQDQAMIPTLLQQRGGSPHQSGTPIHYRRSTTEDQPTYYTNNPMSQPVILPQNMGTKHMPMQQNVG